MTENEPGRLREPSTFPQTAFTNRKLVLQAAIR
jgi:hypothetical protein